MKKFNIRGNHLMIIVIMLIVVVIGGTFAWFTYQSRKSALVLSIGDINDSKVIIKPYQIRETMNPVNTYTSGVYSQVTAINNNSKKYSMVLYYRINELDEVLINNGLKYTIVSSDSLDGEYVEVKTGDFAYAVGSDELEILNEEVEGDTTKYYRVYLWLDSSVGNQVVVQNSVLDLELNGIIETSANKPVLDEGMIPVVISDDGTVLTVSKDDSNWYDYKNKKWANIVLVDSESRSTYLNTENVEVLQEDILAYYVWIPRYKYKVWLMDGTTTSNPQTISIIFESTNDPMMTASKVGDYMTHPAFWWDTNSDGNVDDNEMLPGIWVGKFETTGDATTPTVKPNLQSLRNQNISTQFQTSLKFAGGTLNNGNVSFVGNNTYGLTIDSDSHMMKNSEWGAVAYLSHSNYGLNEEIYINNSSSYYTGRSGGNVAGQTDTSTYGTYSWIGQTMNSDGSYGTVTDLTLGTKASTTGNITGVYDMSGGAWEYVMGVLSDTNGNPRSGHSIDLNSGFNGLLNDNTSYTNGISFPNSKYYDLYLESQFNGNKNTNVNFCVLETCGGYGLNETALWYGDYSTFITWEYPWFIRGSDWSVDESCGVFTSIDNHGAADSYGSWRSVIISKKTSKVTFDTNGGEFEIFNYTSVGEHIYEVPYDGEYKIEVWGAQGGDATFNSYSYNGGYGGYSVGTINLTAETNLYINVGDKGQSVSGTTGDNGTGYNGGGYGSWWSNNSAHGGGGGATHIATVGGQLSTLSEYSNINDSPILIVAGGGGGASAHSYAPSYSGTGGSAGGYVGNSGITANTTCYNYGVGGTKDSAGGYIKCSVDGRDNVDTPFPNSSSFGYGGNFDALTNAYYAGGGAGYYGGGSGYHGPGGGGSSYIGNSLLTNKAMCCYNCTTSSDVSTLTYSTTNVSSTATSNYAKSGSGAAKISLLNATKKVAYYEKYGELPIPTKYGYTFVGWNTKSDGSGITITSSSMVDLTDDIILYAIWEQITYQVNYNANGGSNAPSSQTKIYGQTLVLSSTEPTRSGYTFLGWSTSSTATSATFSAGGNYTSNVSTTLYAVWKINQLYLYNVGNFYSSVTGGWGAAKCYGCSDGYANGVTFNSDHIALWSRYNEYYASVGTLAAINFSGYTKLKAFVYTNDGNAYMYVTSRLDQFSAYAIRYISIGNGSQTVSMDISDISSGYVVLAVANEINARGMNITSVWLE